MITLVITIVIIIILAGAVILNLSDNNPIGSAKKAKVMQDIDSFRTELMLKTTTVENVFNEDSINAVTKEDILKYIPSMEKAKIGSLPYTEILVISEGALAIDSNKANDMITNGKLTNEQYNWIVEALGNNVFNAQTYTIKYYKNDGTEGFTEDKKIHNVKYSILTNETEREGYGFKGWNTAKDGTGTAHNAGDEYTENQDLTLYAQWEAGKYTVTYYKNDGTEEAKTDLKTHDMSYTVAGQSFTREGYMFIGYNTKADGTGTDYAKGASYTENTKLDLYAKWKQAVFTAAEVKRNASELYGAYVNYTPTNGYTGKWRVFLADSARIYLIAEDYVPNNLLSSTGLTNSTSTTNSYKDYCVYSSTNRQDLVTKLSTSSYYTGFKDGAGKASSVVGAPTLEQFVESYNAVNPSKRLYIHNHSAANEAYGGYTSSAEGYSLSFSETTEYNYYQVIATNCTKADLYIRTSDTNAYGMWLASFSAYNANSVMNVYFDGDVNRDIYLNGGIGVRPLVTLNSNVKLVDPDGDGIYDLQ